MKPMPNFASPLLPPDRSANRRPAVSAWLLIPLIVLWAGSALAQSPGQLIRPGDFVTGLQGWWKLDEAGGTRADASVNGNDLLQNGTVSSSSDDYWTSDGISALFSGNAANYLSISDAAQTGLDMTGSWTAAFWVKPSEVSSAKMIFEKGTQFALYLSDLGQLYIYSGGSADPSPGGIYEANKWNHFAVAYNGATNSASVYKNGNLISVETALANPSNTTDPFVVGRHSSNGQPMNGLLKDLGIWSRTLTSQEIKSLASGIDVSIAYRPGNVSVAPTAWWKLNEVSSGSGSVSRADSAGSHTLTDNNTVTAAGGYLEAAAADFERDNSEYLSATDSANWNLGTGDFSLSFWVKPESLGVNQDLICRSDTQFRIGLDTSNNLVWFIEGNERWTRAASGFKVGTWYHLVLRRQGGSVRVFRDGVEIGSAGTSSDDVQSTGVLNLGRNSSGVNHFDGQIADLAFWKGYAPSAAEIKALATALLVQPSGVVSYWALDETSGTRSDAIGTNHLSPVNGPSSAAGIVGTAADFESTNSQYLKIASAAQSGLNPTQAISVFGWVKPESTGSIQVIAARGYGNSGYGLSYRASGTGQLDTGPGAAGSTSTVSTGNWSQIGGVWDGVRKVYFNGTIESNGAGTGPSTTTHDFTLGSNDIPGEYTDGLVDEVLVARRWFRDEEVKALYLRGLNGLKAIQFPEEITVEEPPGSELTDGVSTTSFSSGLATPGQVKTFTIRNRGGLPLTGISALVSGADAGDFVLNTTGMSSTLEAGQSTTFTITFTPGQLGSRTAALTITSSDADETEFNLSLAGTGLSSDPGLSGLTLASGFLSQSFQSATTGYTFALPSGTDTLILTPVSAAPGASITINGVAATSGVARAVRLGMGTNAITVQVIAPDGVTTRTYTLTGSLPNGVLIRPGNLPSGLRGWWKMDEASGTRADASGNGNDLIDTNGTTSVTDDYWGSGERSADFESSNSQRLSITNGAQTGLGLTSTHSISAWIRLESGTTGLVIGKNSGQGEGYGLTVTNLGALSLRVQGNSFASANGLIQVGKWHHVTSVFDDTGDRIWLFVDGNIVSVQNTSNSLTSSPHEFRLGQLGDNTESFDGLIKDAAVWGRVLTPLEIKSLASGIDVGAAYRPGNVSVAPTAWWKLNEVSSGSGAVSRTDSAGSNTLTDNNTVAAAGGYLEAAAADFNPGSSESLSAGDSSTWTIGGGDASFSMWVRFDAVTAGVAYPLFGHSQDGSNFWDLFVDYGSGTHRLTLNQAVGGSNTIGLSTPWTPVAGTWYHVAWTKQGTQHRFYVDGKALGTAQESSTTMADFNGPLMIGRRAGSAATFFDGRQADAAFWKGYALSAAEIKALATALPVQKSGIVSYWPLDEASGTRSDAVGTNHLSSVNGAGNASGAVGNAASFQAASSQYLSISHAQQTGLDALGANTILYWAKPTTTGSLQSVLAKTNGASSGYGTYLTDTARLRLNVNNNTWALGSASVGAGQFHHGAVQYDGSLGRTFINGSLDVSATAPAIPVAASNTLPFTLGAQSDASYFFNGQIDEVVIARRWFRDEEVKALYLRGLAGVPVISWLSAQVTGGPVMDDGTGSVAFGDQAVETTSAVKMMTITNTTAQTLTSLAVVKSGAHPADFIVDTNGMSTSLAPGASTTFTVAFSPLLRSSRSATIEVTSTAAGTTNAFDFSVGGSGIAAAPQVTGISPASARPGRSVVISGANFSSTPANNTVWFGGVKGTVTAASGTQLTVTVPQGARFGPVTVSAFGLAGNSRTFFTASYQGAAGFSGSSFSAATTLSGAYMARLTAGDLDGDGALDVVTGNSTDGTITIFHNQIAPGSLGASAAFPVGTFAPSSTSGATVSTGGGWAFDVNLADLDLDGRLDLIAPLAGGTNAVRVWRKASSGGVYALDAGVNFTTASAPFSCAVADLDGDGLPDIITGHNGSDVTVLRNTSVPGVLDSTSFAAAVNLTIDGTGEIVSAGDLDGDGKPEIVTATQSGKVCIFRNTASPGVLNGSSFSTRIDITTGETMRGARLGDLDGDGDLDIVTLDYQNNDGNEIPVLRNKHTGGALTTASFDRASDLTGNGTDRSFLELADMDGDGRPDLAGTTGLNDGVVWQNQSPLTGPPAIDFGSRLAVTMALQANGGICADFDGDGRTDIAGVRDNAGQFTLVRNLHPFGTPQISVEQPVSTPLTDGAGVLNLGNVNVGASSSVMTVTIRNTGTADLEDLSVGLSGAQMSEFNVSALPATILAPGATMDFTVTFSPAALGTRTTPLQIASNVAGAANPFDLTLTGNGVNGSLITNFTSGGTVGLTTNGLTATGSTATPSLGYAPTPGALLTLVNNTSANLISGTFTNLAQGQIVTLPFSGTDYRFAANYFGGDGNDLVLMLQGPGVLDLSFGGTGKASVDFGSNIDEAGAVGIQSDGKILIAGSSRIGGTDDFSLARINPDGSLDSTFNGSGKVTTDFVVSKDRARALALQRDGKIIVAGSREVSNLNSFALARYLANGNLDTTFDGDGWVLTSVIGFQDNVHGIAIQNDGKIVVVGDSYQNPNTLLTVARYNIDGSLDTSFNSNGHSRIPIGGGSSYGRCLALQSDGKILAAGWIDASTVIDFAVSRFNPNGTLDTSFSGDGVLTTSLGSGADKAHSMVVQRDGKIVVVGETFRNGGLDLAVVRYNQDGSLDPTFNGTGFSLTAVGTGDESATSVSIQIDGKILVGGWTVNGGQKNLLMARYHSNGSIDSSFHGDGITEIPFGSGDDFGMALTTQNNGRIVLVGHSFIGTTFDFSAVRALGESSHNVTFPSASVTPLSGNGLDGTGRTLNLNLTLSFPPTPGTRLTVFDNTGLHPILGEFDNLAHGQQVLLNHNGTDHPFVANYFGGDGNDLVLEWKYNRLMSWGTNASKALGVSGNPAYADTATQVVSTPAIEGKTILATASGRDFSLAVCSDGTVAAWGENGEGQLGVNSLVDSPTPVAVSTAGVLSGKKVVAVSAGWTHSLALCSDGTVAAWGDNVYGQLGDNTTIDKKIPVLVETTGALSGKRVVAISAGETHSVALCSDGTVATWGNNDSRQLGNGGTTRSSVPVTVVTSGILAGKAVKAISAGSSHTLALLVDGTVVSWGSNALYQLGNNSGSNSNVPVAVNTSDVLNGKMVTAIAAGGMTSLVLCSDGTLAAWGNNDRGQVGNDNTGINYGTPQAVVLGGALNGKTVTQIRLGFRHALARCSDGTAVSWGWNLYGQLGNDGVVDSDLPVAVIDSMLDPQEGFAQLSGGAYSDHTVAIVATGLPAPMIRIEDASGNPFSDNGTETFGATLVSTTKVRTYTIRNTGTATMTGIAASLFGTWAADYAILAAPAPTLAPGDATSLTLAFTPSSPVPKGATLRINSNVTTNDLNPFDIALSGSGTNSISLAYTTGAEVPAVINALPFTATGKTINLNPATALNHLPASGSTLMVLDNRTTGFVGGSFTGLTHGQTVMLDYNGASYPFVVSYFGGDGNDVVLLWAGTRLLAWGPNGSGTLGNGTTTVALSPTAVTTNGVLANKTILSVAAGERHALALCADGTLAAWGANDLGQFGRGNTTPSLVPVLVSTGAGSALNGTTVIAIAAGLDFSAALCSDGTVATWGTNSAGQLGGGGSAGGSSSLPVSVSGGAIAGKTVAGIAAGIDFVIARCTDGSAIAWGANGAGQLGDGTFQDRTSPVAVATSGVLGGRLVRSVSAGHFHSLALCTDGIIASWGDNTFGELGDGTTNGSPVPVAISSGGVLSGKIPVAVSAGQYHCLALCSDNTLVSWGVNSEGQLGIQGTAQSSVPLDISSSGALAGRIVTSVACGQGNGMAVLADGSIASWGINAAGQVGDGTNLQRNTPVAIGQGTLVSGERILRAGSGATSSNGFAIVASAVIPPSGTPVLFTDDASSINKTSATLNGVINPNGSSSSVYFEIGTDSGYGLPPTVTQLFSGTSDAPVTQALTGLQPNTTYFIRLAASYNGGVNFAFGDGKAFTTAPDPPSASTGPASNVGTNGVTLNGTINPNGRDTNAKFQLSTDGNFNSILAEFEVDPVAAGASLVPRSRSIVGLVHATTYFYRLIAQNPAGAQLPGEANVVSFTTLNLPPVATTGSTQPVPAIPTRITVNGSVRASNASTNVTFLYGPLNGGFPFSVAATPDTILGDVDTAVTAELSNLQQGRTYQYKVRAVNSGGTVEGSVREFTIASISGLSRVNPGTRPASEGFLTVNLAPSGLAHGWRFFGEQEWRLSGFPALGFPTGNREIEYRPVPGWISPPSESISITSGIATPALERRYFEAGGGGTGNLMVTLVPEIVTNGPERAQWRLLGEDGSAWRDSGTTLAELFPGNYLVECKPVVGRATPPNTSVPVVEGQTAAPTIVYHLPDAAVGDAPLALGFETITPNGDLPYRFVGQIRSRSGSGTGFVVKPRVVATAAHVVWNDITHSAVEGLQWMHQRHTGTYEPKPIEPRGFYVFDGYAAQRLADNSPGDSSPQSQHLDVAAIYFNENAARGGSGGFLASDLDDNEFLLSSAHKVLAGYPVDAIDPGLRGRMHATNPANVGFARGFGRTFTTSDIGSSGGNSGGPLCVQYEGGAYYPAAIYLGGNSQTVVRAIDSGVVDLFNRAEGSGNGGSNNTGGGITHTGVTAIGGVDSPGSLQITLAPAGAINAGAGWRLRPETGYRATGATAGNLKAANYLVELAPVAGYQTPPDLIIRVNGGQAKTLTFTYAPPVVQSAAITVRGNSRNLANGDSSPSILDHTDFGVVEVESGSRARTFTILNSGNATLNLGSVILEGSHPDDFSISIPPGASVPPGSSTSFTILFDPSAPGTRSATVSFATNVSGSNPFTFAIQGNDTTDSDSDGFTDVEETALTDLLDSFTVGQSIDLDLSFLRLGSGQILALLNLPPGLTFDPGTNRITGTITGKAATPQVEIRKLAGADIVSSVTTNFPVFTPARLTVSGARPFPATRIGRRSKPQTLVVTNAGELALNGVSVRTTGRAAREFLVTQPAINTLGSNASTSFTITFKPRSKGNRSASVTIFSNIAPVSLPLSGKGK